MIPGLVDRAVMRWVGRSYARGSRIAQLSAGERIGMLEQFLAEMPPAGQDFHPQPDAIAPLERPVERRWGATVSQLSWPAHAARWNPALAARFDGFPHNQTAHARLFAAGGRTLIVAVHGYGGGRWSTEQRMFPVKRWLAKGYDVALFTLPFHGDRRAPGDKVRLPSAMPLVTVEGFRQGIADLRALLGWARARYERTGVAGMSLGGYTSALLATVEPELDQLMLFIPLSSIPGYMVDHGRMPGSEAERATQIRLLEQVLAPVRPLARAPLLAPERVLVAGAVQDGVTGIHHAEALSSHFGAELIRFRGAHLLQVGRRVAWEALERRLAV